MLDLITTPGQHDELTPLEIDKRVIVFVLSAVGCGDINVTSTTDDAGSPALKCEYRATPDSELQCKTVSRPADIQVTGDAYAEVAASARLSRADALRDEYLNMQIDVNVDVDDLDFTPEVKQNLTNNVKLLYYGINMMGCWDINVRLQNCGSHGPFYICYFRVRQGGTLHRVVEMCKMDALAATVDEALKKVRHIHDIVLSEAYTTANEPIDAE